MSLFLRVVTSHFSGVVTIICVSMSSFLVSCMSPVNSRTTRRSSRSRLPKFSTISCASAFIGATYTILNSSRRSTPDTKCLPTSWRIVNMAQLVLPAPVGAQISMFSLVRKAVWKMADWMRLSLLMP